MPIALTDLLHLADSAFPTGAFAYSSGLEGLACAGCFESGEALEQYLEAYAAQALSQDLPYLNSAYAAREQESNFLPALLWEWDACFCNQAMRKASLRQGKTLLDLLVSLYAHPDLFGLQVVLERESRPAHFLPLLGFALAALGAELAEAQSLYVYLQVRDQISATVRLGLLGPRAAQALQSRLLAKAQSTLPEYAKLRHEAAWKTAPLLEVGQGCHQFLYSRLFQN